MNLNESQRWYSQSSFPRFTLFPGSWVFCKFRIKFQLHLEYKRKNIWGYSFAILDSVISIKMCAVAIFFPHFAQFLRSYSLNNLHFTVNFLQTISSLEICLGLTFQPMQNKLCVKHRYARCYQMCYLMI